MSDIKKIIPCLDLLLDENGGRVVKGVEFEDLRDAGDPVAFAKRYEEQGADELVFLDITASVRGRKTLSNVIERASRELKIPFTIGGGISSLEDMEKLLQAGATKVSVNTAAIRDPDLIRRASEKFGSERIVVAVDICKNYSSPPPHAFIHLEGKKTYWYEVVVMGGHEGTGLCAETWAQKMESFGAGSILLTAKDRDGTREGYDIVATRSVSEVVSIPVIASGGVGTIEHIYEGLTAGKASAALAASIFHFNDYTVRQVKEEIKKRGVRVCD